MGKKFKKTAAPKVIKLKPEDQAILALKSWQKKVLGIYKKLEKGIK